MNLNSDSDLVGLRILVAVCWLLFLFMATVGSGPDPESVARAQAMLFAFSAGIVMVFLAGKSDMAEILKSTYRVFKQRPRVPARDLGNCIFFLLVFGSILALVFVSNVTLVALLGVRVGIVIFILALKAGLDRLRRKI